MAAPLARLSPLLPATAPHWEVVDGWQSVAAASFPTASIHPRERAGATQQDDLTSFVGRVEVLAELHRRLDERRLVTLTGPGGVGKTRLARRLVAERAAGLAAVWTVDLAGLTDPDLLPAAVASALGLVQAADRSPVELIAEAIGERRALLLLDNCEHLVDACAGLACDLLLACPALRILVTSREPLVAPGELAWPVPPLSLSRRETRDERREIDFSLDARFSSLVSEAVQLFVERATRVAPGFALTAANVGAIEEICRRLGGLPLAIELAAARARHLTPPQIAARLAEQAEALGEGARPAFGPHLPSRHRTMRAAIAWSYELLPPEEQALFRRLAVFAGGFTLEAVDGLRTEDSGLRDAGSLERPLADRVSPPPSPLTSQPSAMSPQSSVLSPQSSTTDLLRRLRDTSLLTVDRSDKEERYRLPETIRAFALEQLRQESPGLEARLRRTHAAYYRALVERLSPDLFGPRRARALDRLAAERDNLRAALGASFAPDVAEAGSDRDDGLRLAAALWWIWFHHGEWTEGRTWLERALNQPAGNATLDVLPTAPRATALCGAGWLAFAQGDLATAHRRLSESVAAFRRRRDGRGLALAAGFLSQAVLAQGDLVESRRLAGEAVALARTGNDWDLALARINLGNVEQARGNDLAAGRLYEEGVAAARAAGDRWLEAMGLRNLGLVAMRAGKGNRAVALLRESLTLSYEAGERWSVTRGLEELATIAALDGDPVRAARLLGAAETLRNAIGAPPAPFSRNRHDLAVAAVRRALPAEALATHWAVGGAMTLDEAVGYATHHTAATPSAAAPAVLTNESRPTNVSSFRPVVIRARTREPMEHISAIPSLRITALGPGRVELGGRPIVAADWTYAKPRELLFYLVDHTDRTKEQVGQALWPDATAAQLRGSFHVALHHLRRVLGDGGWVRYADRRYAMDRERPIDYDVARFEECLAAARRSGEDIPRMIAALEEAAALYTGDYLDDHTGDWVETRRDALRRSFLDCLSQLGEAHLAIGRPAEAETAFRRLLGEDSLHEAGHRGLIRALARQGQLGQAIRHYDGLVALLRTEQAAPPAAETSALVARLRRGESI